MRVRSDVSEARCDIFVYVIFLSIDFLICFYLFLADDDSI